MFTKYKQPIAYNGDFIRFNDDRFGNYISKHYGNRAYTIQLHAAWPDNNFINIPAADGLVDLLIQQLSKTERNLGFYK